TSLRRSIEAVAPRRGRQDHAHGFPGSDGEPLAAASSGAACSRAAFGSGPYPPRGAHVHPDRAVRPQAPPDAADGVDDRLQAGSIFEYGVRHGKAHRREAEIEPLPLAADRLETARRDGPLPVGVLEPEIVADRLAGQG